MHKHDKNDQKSAKELHRTYENKEADNSNQYQSSRPERAKKPIERLAPHISHVRSEEAENKVNVEHYNETVGRVIARMSRHCNDKHEYIGENKIQLAQMRSSKKGLKALGDKGEKAACQEMNQTRKRTTFEPVRKEELTESELKGLWKA